MCYDYRMDGFKKFILRGNVVDLAVGIAIGASFNGIVGALTKGVITPLSGSLLHIPDFSAVGVVLNGSKIAFGDVLNATISFVITALVIYFLIVLPMNKLVEAVRGPESPTTKKCPECKSEIPSDATRCAHCAQPVA
jgi:large conductance mechanosensitive channel